MRRDTKLLGAMLLLVGAMACSTDADSDPDYWGDSEPDAGTAGSGGGTGSGSGGTTAAGSCAVEEAGATGDEPGGMIPVCCAPTAVEKADIDEIFALVNEHRADHGVAALSYDTQLEATIQGHCVHMALHPFFDHTAPESSVSSPWTRAEMCGTSANGENIANGQSTPAAVMAGWKSSDGHNQNMLDPDFKRMGVGRHGTYWGQLFGR